MIQSFNSKKFIIQILIQRISKSKFLEKVCDYQLICNSNFHLIQRKTLPTNDFELTGPNLYT